MDIIFNCPFCDQELAADTTDSGTNIDCPSCNKTIKIPQPGDEDVRTSPTQEAPPASGPLPLVPVSQPPRLEKEFVVPQRVAGSTSESLIEKSKPPLEAAAKAAAGTLRVKTIKHGDCIEVGKDKFDEVISEFLGHVGLANLVSVTPVTYTHTDATGSRLIADFAVVIIYKE
jgi:hypothetical protein